MTFDLKITFTGMILYVPAAGRLEVLMPRTPDAPSEGGGTGCDCMEPHAARLTFDSAYGRPGAPALDDAVTHVSLRQRRLEVPAVGSAYVQGIPPVLAVAPSRVRADVLDGQADDDLTARVKVSTGQVTWVDPGDCWEYLGEIRRMSHLVEWTISGIDAEHLDLPLTDPDGLATAGSVPRLYPIDGRIEVQVWHVPSYELPPDASIPDPPADGTPNHHFAHLAILLEGGAFPAPLYRPGQCSGFDSTSARGGDVSASSADRGGASLGCTGAQSPGDDDPGSRHGLRGMHSDDLHVHRRDESRGSESSSGSERNRGETRGSTSLTCTGMQDSGDNPGGRSVRGITSMTCTGAQSPGDEPGARSAVQRGGATYTCTGAQATDAPLPPA